MRTTLLTIGTISIQRARIVVTVDREPTAAELRSYMVALRRPEDEVAEARRRSSVLAVPTDVELAE